MRALAARAAGAGAAARVRCAFIVATVPAASSALLRQRRLFAADARAPGASRAPQPRVAAAAADSASDHGAAGTPPPLAVVPWRKEAANGVTLIGTVGSVDILTFATGVRARIRVAVRHKRRAARAVVGNGDATSNSASTATQPEPDWCAHRCGHVGCMRRFSSRVQPARL